MKLKVRMDFSIEIDDGWLREMWDTEPVADEKEDAVKVAIDTLRERLGVSPPYDPVNIKSGDWVLLE